MPARIFLSCGQHTVEERQTASNVQFILSGRGFDVYVAINAQTILEINAGIIGELKNSDCYLFINFRREAVDGGFRGSLFSNQELAIAYALGFDRILVINQKNIRREGLLGYIGNNAEEFETFSECCDVVIRALDRAKWTATYSRRLLADNLFLKAESIVFGHMIGRFLYLDIRNGRSDIAALEATARLSEFGQAGIMQPSPILSPLKASGRSGFSHTIFPKSHEAFDLLCIGGSWSRVDEAIAPAASGSPAPTPININDPGVYLNSALDVVGAGRLPIEQGKWILRYEFYAIGFPLLCVSIELDVTDWSAPTATLLSQYSG
jgi:hypothetical protein